MMEVVASTFKPKPNWPAPPYSSFFFIACVSHFCKTDKK
jgi:hypothetical protein